MTRDGSWAERPGPREHRGDPAGEPVILWQVPDAGELAARFASVGADVERGPGDDLATRDAGRVNAPPRPGEEWLVRLAGGVVVVRPASGVPSRLAVLRGPFAGSASADADRELATGVAPLPPRERRPGAALMAIGWGTVDIERTAAWAGAAAGPGIATATADRLAPLPADVALGARVAELRGPWSPPVLLLEPEREGRLAASLARFAEGPCVLYLRASPAGTRSEAAHDDDPLASPIRPIAAGPFGREYVVPGGAPWGPHVLVVTPGADRHPTVPRDRVPSRP